MRFSVQISRLLAALLATATVLIGGAAYVAGVNVGRIMTEDAYAATQRSLDDSNISGYLHETFPSDSPWLAQIRKVSVSPIVDLVTMWAPAEYAPADALTAYNAVRGYFRTGARSRTSASLPTALRSPAPYRSTTAARAPS